MGCRRRPASAILMMAFAEPDLEVTAPGQATSADIARRGSLRPPTQIRSNSIDEAACWFIDTSYNGETFFVRHACFTGADQSYQRLRKALRAEMDETAWSSRYSILSARSTNRTPAKSWSSD